MSVSENDQKRGSSEQIDTHAHLVILVGLHEKGLMRSVLGPAIFPEAAK
jgi:hypothetical protein